jgi:hypothetical protein
MSCFVYSDLEVDGYMHEYIYLLVLILFTQVVSFLVTDTVVLINF